MLEVEFGSCLKGKHCDDVVSFRDDLLGHRLHEQQSFIGSQPLRRRWVQPVPAATTPSSANTAGSGQLLPLHFSDGT